MLREIMRCRGMKSLRSGLIEHEKWIAIHFYVTEPFTRYGGGLVAKSSPTLATP